MVDEATVDGEEVRQDGHTGDSSCAAGGGGAASAPSASPTLQMEKQSSPHYMPAHPASIKR